MMKYVIAALLASSLVVTPAFAATTATYSMTGTVVGACTVTATGALAFNALTDSSGATTITTPSPVTDVSAFCNQAGTTVKVQHTDLVTSATAPTGFANTLPITSAQVTTPQNGTGVTDNLATTGATCGAPALPCSTGTSSTLGAFKALTVTIVTGSIGTNKFVAGTYTGSVIVTLTPGN